MNDREYEHLVTECQRLLDITTATRDSHNKACHDWSELYEKLKYEQTRRKIVAEYIKEQQNDSVILVDLEAGETP